MYDPMNEELNRDSVETGNDFAENTVSAGDTPDPVLNEMPTAPEMPNAPELSDAPELSEQQLDQTQADAFIGETPVQTDSIREGEYHYGPAQQYTEPLASEETPQDPPQAPAQNYTQQQSGYTNPQYPYGQNTYPYGNSQYPYGQQNKNPYSAGNRNWQNPQQGQQQPYPNRQPGGYPYGGNRNNNPYAYSNQGGEKKKGSGGRVLIALLAVLAVVILVVVITHVGKKNVSTVETPTGVSDSDTTSKPQASSEKIENVDEATTAASPVHESVAGQMSATDIYKKILPSSVGILVYSNSSKQVSSEGSGVIIQEDTDGKYTYILTCAHVITGASQSIVVQLYDEKQYTAEVVGFDSRTDIGVIRIEESGLQTLAIGDSSSLRVGETVYAIGNPGGTEFANTFTNGMVTALDRPVASSSTGYSMECIQHNAAINPGNSGGALVNQYGQLIGINSMKIVDDEYEGMGFAVPSSVFVEVLNEIVANGYVTNRPKIGITYLRASSQQSYAMFVAIKGLPGGSIIVDSVADDSDFKDKLNKGDLITAINGEDLNSSADLAAMIEEMKVGDNITLHVVRINTDYSFEEVDVTGVLVEDKQTNILEEETTTYNSFEDYFGDYFDDYFGGFGVNP